MPSNYIVRQCPSSVGQKPPRTDFEHVVGSWVPTPATLLHSPLFFVGSRGGQMCGDDTCSFDEQKKACHGLSSRCSRQCRSDMFRPESCMEKGDAQSDTIRTL